MGEKKWLSDTSGSGFSLGKTKQAIEIQHLSWESQKAPYTIDSRPVSLKLAVSANFFFPDVYGSLKTTGCSRVPASPLLAVGHRD